MVRSCIAALVLLTAGHAWADLPQVQQSTLKRAGVWTNVQIEVRAPSNTACLDVDLLIRLAPESSDAESALADLYDNIEPFGQIPWGVVRLDGRQIRAEPVNLRATALSQLEPGQTILVTQRGDVRYVRARMRKPLAAGEARTISLRLPFASPERIDAMVIGYRLARLRVQDFNELPGFGVVGLTALLRTCGLEGSQARRRQRIASLRKSQRFAAALADMVEQEMSDAGKVHTLGVAAALWLTPHLSPKRYRGLVAKVLSSTSLSWGERFVGSLDSLKTDDELLWALALDHLMPRAGKTNLTLRLLALGAHVLSAGEALALVKVLIEAGRRPARVDAVRTFAQVAGSALVTGADKWPASTAKAVLGRLGQWGAASGVLGLYRRPAAIAHIERKVGSKLLLAECRRMLTDGIPTAVVDGLAAPDRRVRAFANSLLVSSGLAGLQAAAKRLRTTGYPWRGPTTAGTLATDPKLAHKVVDRLQGVLLTRAAAGFVAEAERLHLLEGDCLAQFEAAQAQIHPQIILPQPLYAACQSLRANALLEAGKYDEADRMALAAMRGAPNVLAVKKRYNSIMTVRTRRLLESGDVDGALQLAAQIDPQRRDPQVRGMLADIELARGKQALAAKDTVQARKHFAAARELDSAVPPVDELMAAGQEDDSGPMYVLLLLSLLAGAGAAVYRYLSLQRAIAEFDVMAEDRLEMQAPGRRRILVGNHGLLAVRGWSYRLVLWAGVRAGYVVNNGPSATGLLFWGMADDAFFVDAVGVPGFNGLIQRVDRGMRVVEVPFLATPSDDDWVQAENNDMVARLAASDKKGRQARYAAIALGGVAFLCFGALGMGSSVVASTRFMAGIGIGVSIGTVALTVVDAKMPIERT